MAVVKVCGCCGKEFSVPNRRHETVKFCSRECKTNAGWESFTCVKCGTGFRRKKSDNPGDPRRYCSMDCHHADKKGKKYQVDDRPRYHKVCETCGVQFRVTETRKDTARFCSRKCQSASPEFRKECSEAQQGDKHWRWAGGVYKCGTGYARHKSKVLGEEKFVFIHRTIILMAMLESEPDHPFIIEKNGVKKLRTEIEVHHIDRNRSNNVLSNLLAVTKHAHAQIHHRNSKPKPWECWPRDPSRW